MRSFAMQSALQDDNLALALAPALTPQGIELSPTFFDGVAVYPQIVARGLLVLADVTATRYFKYEPVSMRDPVLSAQGDRLRAECFSACNGVYARLDLLESGFDGHIDFGTTNVDIGTELRAALTKVGQKDRLHVNIGSGGLTTTHADQLDIFADVMGESQAKTIHERPVEMPDRWLRALGNAAEIHRGMQPVFSLKGVQAQVFIGSLPTAATSKRQEGWLIPTTTGAKLTPYASSNAVYISGLHRLGAIKRIMTNVKAITFYANDTKQCMVEMELPGSRLTLSLTAEPWEGYSGEGALLAALANQELLEDADSIGAMLEFDALIDSARIAEKWHMDANRVQSALALLAVSGKLGYDAHDNAYFHRELPYEPERVLKDNPRLVGAQKLLEAGAVQYINGDKWLVKSKNEEYSVIYGSAGMDEARCGCEWYFKHQNRRGPCKHILAVKLKQEAGK